MFDKFIGNQAENLMEKADLNKDGIPDKQQVAKLAADLGKAADDLGKAIDVPKAAAAVALLQEGGNELLKDSSVIANLATQKKFKELAKTLLTSDELHEDLGKVFAGILQLQHSIDQSKFAVALGDLKVAQKDIEDYIHPKKK